VRWWKVLARRATSVSPKWFFLAALTGVAATGVVIARAERRRRAYTPEEIRARLHERLAEATAETRRDPDE
jgi:hypothetical protein